MQMKNYFLTHYAIVNKIDPSNEESIKSWYSVNNRFCNMELKKILEMDISKKRIVDLGCGIGGLMNYLIERGAKNICGVDCSIEQLDICKKYITNDLYCEDVFDFLEREMQFDLIFAFDIVEHIKKEKIIQFIERCYNRLSEGGKIIIRTPNIGNLFGPYIRYNDFTHEIGFTEQSIKQVLMQFDFKKVDVMNSCIGNKRLFTIEAINWIVEKIYNIEFSKIVTLNLIAVAQR
jgi:2-polyprenyl-3-methyl-5-hydroxy-6-metoxy-1,4-benzoquinol methylase